MSKSNTFENDILQLLFNNVDIADIGDAGGIQNSATAGSLYLALHIGDPGEAGDATTNEAAYTDYARVAVARSGAGWTVAGNTVTNAAQVTFPQCGVTGATITYGSITTAASGASKILYSGALSSSLAVAENITPFFAIGSVSVTED